MTEKILVTGADGFIGSHLVEELLKRKKKVRALVQYNSFNNSGWLEDIRGNKNLEIVFGDIRSYDLVNDLTKGISKLFHLAALISIPYSYKTPESFIETNIKGTLNILESSKLNKIKKIIITSTSEVYGTANYVPIDEMHPIQTQSPYSASKYSADKIAESYALSFDLPVIIARPFNNYGPRQSTRAIIPTIITQLLNGKKLKLGKLDTFRDFVYVKDTADSLIKLSNSKFCKAEVFNICSGKTISINETALKISKILKKSFKLKLEKKRLRPKNSEVQILHGCNKKIKKNIQWRPKTNFDSGLKKTIEWFSNSENIKKYNNLDYNI